MNMKRITTETLHSLPNDKKCRSHLLFIDISNFLLLKHSYFFCSEFLMALIISSKTL